uniref:Uncharacterized protein n=1 Tax=Amphimedon queenslandica TaxID=400682 RepID=A0A1X7SD83_AMPQE
PIAWGCIWIIISDFYNFFQFFRTPP